MDQEVIRISQRIQDTKEQVSQLEQENEILKQGVNERQKNCAESKTALTAVEIEIESLKTSHIETVTREAQLNSTITSNQSRLKSLEEELAQLVEHADRLTLEIQEKQTQHDEQKISADQANQLSFGFQESQKATQRLWNSLNPLKLNWKPKCLKFRKSSIQAFLNCMHFKNSHAPIRDIQNPFKA